MKVGIYVGSFNPVHNDHVRVANAALKYMDKVIIIPTGAYWDKNNLTDIKDRIAMLKLISDDRIIIDAEHNNIQYTYQILEKLSKSYDELYLIIGADSIIRFDEWMNYKEILKYGLIIFNRNNIDVKSYLDKLGKKDNYIIVNDFGGEDISSTKIREYLSCNDDRVKYLINLEVLKYINDHGLYK